MMPLSRSDQETLSGGHVMTNARGFRSSINIRRFWTLNAMASFLYNSILLYLKPRIFAKMTEVEIELYKYIITFCDTFGKIEDILMFISNSPTHCTACIILNSDIHVNKSMHYKG